MHEGGEGEEHLVGPGDEPQGRHHDQVDQIALPEVPGGGGKGGREWGSETMRCRHR